MTVRVKLFASAKELAGGDSVTIDVPANATLADVREAIVGQCGALREIMPHAMWAVNTEYATEDTRVTDKSEIAIIPPVSGG